MLWKSFSTPRLGNKGFSLWNDGKKLLTLAYKSGQPETIYLESSDGQKRIFHYRKKGIFRNHIVLQNEYGVDLGKLHKEGNEQSIIVDDEKYVLKFKNSNNEIEIIDAVAERSVAVCNIENDINSEATNNSLLMVSCIYLHTGQRQPAYQF